MTIVPSANRSILNSMAGRTIQILVVEADPVVRSGLSTCLNRFPDLQIAAEAETKSSALVVLMERMGTTATINLVLFGLPIDLYRHQLVPMLQGSGSANEFCQQVKTTYPNLPILLLTPFHPDLQQLRSIGVEGCYVRGRSILDLVAAIRQVAAGEKIWVPEVLEQLSLDPDPRATKPKGLRQRLGSASLQQIEAALFQANTTLAHPQISALDRSILTGRRRELNTARWLVQRLLPGSQPPMLTPTPPLIETPPSAIKADELTTTNTGSITPKALQAGLFDRVTAKLQFNLENLTPTPLEIDLLKLEKKRELCYLILRQLEGLLDELRLSQVTVSQLSAKQSLIRQDLWASVTSDFFGRYYDLSNTDLDRQIVPILLQDREIVRVDILDRIPQMIDLLNYLLFQMPLTIDNQTCAAGTQAAADRANDLLENLTIHLANAVIQPLLNYFGNLDEIKSRFFDRRLLSTREIERFRNDLSWRYRIERYFSEPQAIFESKHRLFIFTVYGIKSIAIYAPRTPELERLTGVPLTVTLALETRDAIVPRLQSAATIIGSVVVYLLTEVIGRGIGLIGRGVIKGIGNIWQERNYNRRE